MPAPTFKQLEAFVIVAALKNFRRAAEKLNTTQPNISTRIAGLESLIGKSLFSRNKGAFRLTIDGERLLPYAQDVLNASTGFMTAAGKSTLTEGVLRLGVSEMVVHTFLTTYLKRLKESYPHLQVELTVDLSSSLSSQLFDRNHDLTLQSGPFERKTSGLIDLGATDMVWTASPDLGLGGRIDLTTVNNVPIMTHAKGTLAFEQISAYFEQSHHKSIRLTPSSNLAACLQMTREGLGLACLPKAIVEEDVKRGTLAIIKAEWSPDPLSFAARFFEDTATTYVRAAAEIAQDVARIR